MMAASAIPPFSGALKKGKMVGVLNRGHLTARKREEYLGICRAPLRGLTSGRRRSIRAGDGEGDARRSCPRLNITATFAS